MSTRLQPRKTIVNFVRHAEVSNPAAILYARLPRFRLSQQGKVQANRIGQYFADHELDGLYHSPMLRARQTMRYIAEHHEHLIPKKSAHLDEILTPFEGHKLADIEAIDWDIYRDVPRGFESPDDIVKRIQHFCQRVIREHHGKEVVAVTHGDIVIFAQLWGLGKELTHDNRMGIQPYPDHCSITRLTFTGNGAQLPTVEYLTPIQS